MKKNLISKLFPFNSSWDRNQQYAEKTGWERNDCIHTLGIPTQILNSGEKNKGLSEVCPGPCTLCKKKKKKKLARI